MKQFKPRINKNPEHLLQEEITKMLRYKGWYVKSTHGNMYQSGFPDLYVTHARYGGRWIEVKLPEMKGSHFTAAQLECFPLFSANGTGIWILVAATEDEYAKLFKKPNWEVYRTLWT